MTMFQVAVYVQKRYAKPAYAIESYNARAWPGLEMIIDAVRRGGIDVVHCGADTVSKYKVVLVSITSACDWFPFVKERLKWPKTAKPVVIVAGAGVANIRPFLRWADIFYFGRAEQDIASLVRATLIGERFDSPHVAYSADFKPEKRYEFNKGQVPYPHTVTLSNGKKWGELSYGCQRKCLFCGYTWHRNHVGGLQNEAGAGDVLWASSGEKTMFELDLADADTWGFPRLRILGLDGFSERLRRMVNKPITSDMLTKVISALGRAKAKPNRLKFYNIVGYPTETTDDWRELKEDIRRGDSVFETGIHPSWGLEIHCTPFRAMPGTPLALWPMAYENFRGKIANVLADGDCKHHKSVFLIGKRCWVCESTGTESLGSVMPDVLALRGTEDDSELVARLSSFTKFWSGPLAFKIAVIEKHFDIPRLMGTLTWDTLPTRYLIPDTQIPLFDRLDRVARKRAGRPFPE